MRRGLLVALKGIHKVRAKGKTYLYAWRGGPRLTAAPGTRAFLDEFNEAHAARRRPSPHTLFSLIAEFKLSSDFSELSPRSQRDYFRYLPVIEQAFGTMPLKALESPKARGHFKAWRDRFSSHPRKADHLWTTLSRVLAFAKDRGRISVNVCERGGRLYHATRKEKIWSEDHIQRFLQAASPELQLSLVLALWTGQRQGDLLRLRWSDVSDTTIRLMQRKTGATVEIPLGPTLRQWLTTASRRDLTILVGRRGNPWTPDGFRTEWRKAAIRAGVREVTFHDLRGTAVTRLAMAGCTVPEISSITGHSLKDADAILSAHYLGGQLQLAEGAMAKREEKEQGTETVKPIVKL